MSEELVRVIATDSCNSIEILKDWISLIDEDGWVAREQILGEESRSKVRSVKVSLTSRV